MTRLLMLDGGAAIPNLFGSLRGKWRDLWGTDPVDPESFGSSPWAGRGAQRAGDALPINVTPETRPRRIPVPDATVSSQRPPSFR